MSDAVTGGVVQRELPTGVLTFLMSDVEGSTRLWERHPEAMAEAIVRHDELIAEVVEAHGGQFVKSMGDGDSTTSVFESAGQAIRAAIEAVRSLADATWPEGAPIRVRFGLHTGEADQRAGVYLGTTPNLAARVRGQARGGEVLMSETTAALVCDDLPPGYSIVELGPHTLKGIRRPEAIRALVGPGLETSRAAAECPFRGLLAFQSQDRELFFGREEALREVLARIAPGRLLAVVGPSGSGKSSLLRAGVMASVSAGELACVRSCRLITPGAEPPLDLDGDADELLIVDQFEELYTQCADGELRARFIEAMLARGGPVLIGLRADFYGEMSAQARLAAGVASNQVLLGPMREEDLRRAIAEPARIAGLELEPGLTDLVLRDAAGEPGALPLVSHALRETWERRDGRTLSVEAYRESGGVSSAVAQTADAILLQTPESDRPLLRNIFLRLTELGDGVEDTRRRVRIEELVPGQSSSQTVKALLERLAEARLVTLDEGTAELAHEILIRRWPTLRAWLEEDREGVRLHRRLGDAARLWDAAGREPADLYRGTRLAAASEWAEANGALLNETERNFLDTAVEESALTERRRQTANRRLRRALLASACLLLLVLASLVFALASRHAAVGAEASARSQALATESEAVLPSDPQLALLLARAALARAATPQAELAASEALDANTLRAQLPPLGVQSCDSSNYLILLDAGRVAADDTCGGDVVFADLAANRIIRSVHVGTTTTDMILNASKQALIVATGRDLVTVDVHTGAVHRLFRAPFEIEQVAGPPGEFLAIANREKIALVDPRHGSVRVIARGDPSVNGVNGMMSASRHMLLVVSTGQSPGSGTLLPRLTALDVVTGGRSTATLESPPHVASVVYERVSPDERTWYITGANVNPQQGDQVATTWAVDAATRRVRWTATGPSGAYASPVQISPDSKLVAVGYSTGAADVLEARTGRLLTRDSSSSTVASGDLALAAGDKLLVSASLDGLLRTWSARGSERARLQAPGNSAVSFAPDGRDIVLLGNEGEIVSPSGAVLRTFQGFPAESVFNYCTSCYSASPGLRWLTYLDPTSSSVPRVIEIEGLTGHRVARVAVPRLEAQAVAPDGEIVATYDESEQVHAELIDPRLGQARALPPGQSSTGCIATAPTFTPDSGLMAIDDGCTHLTVWNLRSGRIVRTIVLPEHAEGAGVLSPDGRYVLVPVPGGTFVRADTGSGRVVEVPGGRAPTTSLAVSPDGRFYAIGREDGTVDEYDARTLRLVRHHILDSPISGLVFSPDASRIAVEDTSDVVRVWDTCEICENAGRLAQAAAAESVRTLTPSERMTFDAPQGP